MKKTFIYLCMVAWLFSGCATTAKITDKPVPTGAYVNGYAVQRDAGGLFIIAQNGHKLYLK